MLSHGPKEFLKGEEGEVRAGKGNGKPEVTERIGIVGLRHAGCDDRSLLEGSKLATLENLPAFCRGMSVAVGDFMVLQKTTTRCGGLLSIHPVRWL
jgi:hypothetical protein